jgi:beta-glucanase (GH16 family)
MGAVIRRPEAPPVPADSTPASGWTLVWADEFDGPADSPPDPAHWGYEVGDGTGAGNVGWGNQELQSYTRDAANASVDGQGNLQITAREADGGIDCYYGKCRYTSARLLTANRFDCRYGKVVARIRVPAGAGMWPAFWMLGTNIEAVPWPGCGEIDVMEHVGRLPNRIFPTIHGPGYSGDHAFGRTLDLPAPAADEFHVYALEWAKDHLSWTIDGQLYHQTAPPDVAPNEWVFNHPFFLLLNVAVGGTFGGPVGPDTRFPQSMSVDNVHVYSGAVS